MPRPFTEHPQFWRVSGMVNVALAEIAQALDCADALNAFETNANRVADDLTKLILRAYDRDHV